MARAIRIQYPGAVYHIISRGNEKKKIFNIPDDYRLFIKVFIETIDRYNWECYAYCLMPNHYHLLIKTLDPNLSTGMCQLNGDYSQKFNIEHSRVGHLFQGRYKSILVEEEKYKNKLIRYMTLNPMRAKLVNHLDDWQWSSHFEILGKTTLQNCVYVESALNQFSSRLDEGRKIYTKYLREKTENDIFLEKKTLLGSDKFINKVKKYFKKQKNQFDIPKKERFAFRPELNDLFKYSNNLEKKERNKLIHRVHIEYGYTFSEIGRAINMHHSSVGRIVKELI